MNTLKILSDSEVGSMHHATLRILTEVGVILTHPGALRMLTDAGATIRNDRVCLPPELVQECLARCPSQVRVRGRGGVSKTLGDGSLNFHNLGGDENFHSLQFPFNAFPVLISEPGMEENCFARFCS